MPGTVVKNQSSTVAASCGHGRTSSGDARAQQPRRLEWIYDIGIGAGRGRDSSAADHKPRQIQRIEARRASVPPAIKQLPRAQCTGRIESSRRVLFFTPSRALVFPLCLPCFIDPPATIRTLRRAPDNLVGVINAADDCI